MPDPEKADANGAGATQAADVAAGSAADDETISGGAAPDTTAGGAGTDTTVGTAGADTTASGAGTNAVSGSGTQQSPSVRELLRQQGIDPSRFADDAAALTALVASHRQLQQVTPLVQYGQRYVEHAADFEAWRRQQEAEEAARKKQQNAPWFNPPDFDPAWLAQVEADENGNLRPKAGVSPEVVQKVQRYAQFRREFQENFWRNPEQVLMPLIERVAQQKAEQIVTGNLGTYRDQAAAEQFVQANASWLYQNDSKGRAARDPATGQPLLSQDGVRFRDYVNQAIQMGIAKLEHQQQYALSMVERDRVTATQGAAATNQVIKQNFLQQAAQRTANHAGSTTTQQNPNAPAQNTSLSLAERLRADLAAAGITDRDLAA